MGGLGKGKGQGTDTIRLWHLAAEHEVLCGWGEPGAMGIFEV